MHDSFDPRLLAFLRDPASYPHCPRELREAHTHASLVFLVPPFVYKIKKPVDFGFLDFSSLEKRRYFCRREVELNSRLSPGIYLGVESITREGAGFAFGGNGPEIEVAVKMRWLEPEGFLDARISGGTAGPPELERVARTLAAFYQEQRSTAEIAAWGHVGHLRVSTDENFSQTAAFVGETLSRAAFEAIRAFTSACYEQRRELFEKRVGDGWIRDCHGDLHLDHIHVTKSKTCIYDCIEFNDRFRHIDVASDVGFLAMDLDYHGRPDLGCFFVRRMVELTGDPGMDGLMDFYKCYRAYVRGKVESLHSVAEAADAPERAGAAAKARRYFQLALKYAVSGSSPIALVVLGRVASGKSTLARALSHELGWPLISSDERRKTLAGVPLCERGSDASRSKLYGPAMTSHTYDSMIRDAGEALNRGRGVVLDATFSKRRLRDILRQALGDARVRWVVAEADDATTSERLRERETRTDVISDARTEDRDFLNADYEAPDEIPPDRKRVVKARGPREKVVRMLLVGLASDAGAGPQSEKRPRISPGPLRSIDKSETLRRGPRVLP